MTSDARGRRLRTAPPNPMVRRLVLTEADYLIFEAIDRHGPLPSHYLYEFTQHLRRDRSHLQNRLTEFYNGDRVGPFLTRPPQQFASYCGRYQHLVYDLAPRARQAIAERGPYRPFYGKRTDPFVHRLMGACVGASIELGARARGIRYIGLDEILAHPSCGGARNSTQPLALPLADGLLVPDALFGLHYPEKGYRFFAVEIDRHTESIERKNLHQSSFARKIEAYAAVLAGERHRVWWGVPNLCVLVTTTSARHAENLLNYVAERALHIPTERIAIVAVPTFGADWRVPLALLNGLIA